MSGATEQKNEQERERKQERWEVSGAMALCGQRQETEEETVYIYMSVGQLRQDLTQIGEAYMTFSQIHTLDRA